MTFVPVVVFKKLPGDQLILPLAVATISMLSPIHIVVSLGSVIVGTLTSRFIVSVSEPQESETTTENVVLVKNGKVGIIS